MIRVAKIEDIVSITEIYNQAIDARFQTAFTERLDSMGIWLKKNGYTIYGTHAGYMKPQEWGAITENGSNVYLHVFKTDGDKFFVKIPYQVKSARMDGHALHVQALPDNYIMIDLKGVPLDPVDAIIQLQVEK